MENETIEERRGNVEIPKQLLDKNFRFCKVKGKSPIEKSWQKGKPLPDILEWIQDGRPVGIVNGFGRLGVIDIDDPNKHTRKAIIKALYKEYPTYIVKTASGKHHLYYYLDREYFFQSKNDDDGMIFEIRGDKSHQCVAPINSGYETFKDLPIADVTADQLMHVLQPWIKKAGEYTKQEKAPIKTTKLKGATRSREKVDLIEQIKSKIPISKALAEMGCNTAKNPTNCVFHDSKGGKCLSFDDNKGVWNCFHCGQGGDIFNLYCIANGLNVKDEEDFKKALKFLCGQAGIEYKEIKQKTTSILEDEQTTIYRKIAGDFYQRQPYYYDSQKKWWLWDKENLIWKMVDSVDIMIQFDKHFVKATDTASVKGSYLEAMRKQGRVSKPKDAPKTWIQFNDIIVDYESGNFIKPHHDYFMCNIIPWDYKKGDTPTIDNLFADWVGDNFMLTLKEVCAYIMVNEYRLHRIICLLGEGANGKGSCLRFIHKLIGDDNCCSSDFEQINGRFESSILYHKLLCEMGDIDKTIFKKTGQLKGLTGGDSMRLEFKGKDTKKFYNYAKIVCAGNKLPDTSDKSYGFYRRWCILDFNNTFSERKEIINEIPDEEFKNFCGNSINVLQQLFARGSFDQEGSVQERAEKYNDRAGYIRPFLKEHCEQTGSVGDYIGVEKFRLMYLEYLNSINQPAPAHAIIGRQMSIVGYNSSSKRVGADIYRVYKGIKWLEGIV